MGATISTQKTIIDTINKSVSDALIENLSSCGINSSILQSINFSNIEADNCDISFSNISQSANSFIDVKCIDKNLNEFETLSKIKNNLTNNFKTETSGLNFGLNANMNTTIDKKVTEIVNNINIRNLSECINNSIIQQTMNFGNIKVKNCKKPLTFDNISQQIINTQVSDCIGDNQNIAKIVNDIVNETKQDFSTKTVGLDFNVIIILLIVAGGGFILFKMNMLKTVFTNKYILSFIVVLIISVILWLKFK